MVRDNDYVEFNRYALRRLQETNKYDESIQDFHDSSYKYAKFLMNEELEVNKICDRKDELGLTMYQVMLDGLDRSRTMLHNTAMDTIDNLNRDCIIESIVLFYPGEIDNSHRTTVANSIIEYYHDMFADKLDRAFA